MVQTVKSSTRCKLGKLNIAVISDIHLGHRNNPAESIIKNLEKALPDNAETAALDIIFLAGDVFDDALMLNDEDIHYIDHWIGKLLRFCKQHSIILRILEGTPLHDRKQSERFITIDSVMQIKAPLKYIKELEIEYISEYGIYVLYVPDELPGGPDKTLQDFKDLLRVKGIEQVDFAIMHGLFEFQLPPHVPAPRHNSQAYLALVKELIFIGHDHAHKQLERIYVQGSFDRLSHGYESPKGHIRALQQYDGIWDIEFVENKDAMKFITINCSELSIEDTLIKIEKETACLPDNSYVRIEANSVNPIFSNMASLIKMRPLITWSKLPRHKKEDELSPLEETDSAFIPISITRENIAELLLDRLACNMTNGALLDSAQSILEELYP